MKRLLNLLLVIFIFGLLIGCNDTNNDDLSDLSRNFTVEGLSLDNVEEDGRSQYYSKINSLITDIDYHSLYPSFPYTDNLDQLRSYYYDGVSKDDYVLEDEKTLLYS